MDLTSFSIEELYVLKTVFDSFDQGDVIDDLPGEEEGEIYEKIKLACHESLRARRNAKIAAHLKEHPAAKTIVARLVGNPFQFFRFSAPLECISPDATDAEHPLLDLGFSATPAFAVLALIEENSQQVFKFLEFRFPDLETLQDWAISNKTNPGQAEACDFEFEMKGDWTQMNGHSVGRVSFPRAVGEIKPFSGSQKALIEEKGRALLKCFDSIFAPMELSAIKDWVERHPQQIKAHLKKIREENEK